VIYSALGSGIAPVFILIFLTRRVFYLLDIRNQLRDIAKGIKKQIIRRIREAEATQTRTAKNRPSPLLDIEMKYRKWNVDPTVTKWLKEKCDIIFDVVQKAVQENRFEIVEGGLETIVDLTRGYVAGRKEYRSGEDDFITYIRDRLIDTKNLVTTTTHPKVMDSIIKTAGEIAKETLKIESIKTTYGRNFLPYSFVLLLKDIALSNEISKETSYAPMNACTQLVEIGKIAIDMKSPITAAAIAKELSKISKTMTQIHSFYTDCIAVKANWGIACLLSYTVGNLEKIQLPHRENILEMIGEAVNESIRSYLEDEPGYHIPRGNITPFVGPILTEHGIATILLNAIVKATTWDGKIRKDIIEFVKKFLDYLKEDILLGIQKNKKVDVNAILSHIYTIGMGLMQFINRIEDSEALKEVLQEIMEKIGDILYNSMSFGFNLEKQENPVFKESLHLFSSLIGGAFFEGDENKENIVMRVAEKKIRKLIDLIELGKTIVLPIECVDKKREYYNFVILLSQLYQHLRLIGSWVFKWMPKSELLYNIKEVLKNQPKITFIRKSIIGCHLDPIETEFELYPRSLPEVGWLIEQPLIPILTMRELAKVNMELFDVENIKKFEKFLKDES